ncbi:sensor histidine kinase [Streptomyces sp. NPDC059785]|uniref:sensor histidine kinase n=1 Tax=Streptomyces sp. NPDC059785 TaxID=3346945 RepID=UPI003662B6FA
MKRADPAFVALLYLIEMLVYWEPANADAPQWVVACYAAGGYLPLLWRRRFPLLVLLIVVVHAAPSNLWFSRDWFNGYSPALSPWVALGVVGFYCDRRAALYGLTAVYLLTAAGIPSWNCDAPRQYVEYVITQYMLLLAFFLVGRWAAWQVKLRHGAAADAVEAERVRIARDLHDIVAHAVSLMLLQAAGAARVLRKCPDRAETALGHVDELGQQAVVELRRMLGLLSPDADCRTGQGLPTLNDLQLLVERTRTDIFEVELDITGSPMPLDPGVDLSTYRIVQEALTNAVRYADERFPVKVTVVWHRTELDIEVCNRVSVARRHRAHPLSVGRGVIGMRERAAAVGGSCQAGLQADGSFLVRASFPLSGFDGRVSVNRYGPDGGSS